MTFEQAVTEFEQHLCCFRLVFKHFRGDGFCNKLLERYCCYQNCLLNVIVQYDSYTAVNVY